MTVRARRARKAPKTAEILRGLSANLEFCAMLAGAMPDETSFARLMETADQQSLAPRLRAGDVVTAAVIQIASDWVFLDVGTPSDGRLARSEVTNPDGTLRVAVGESLRATVVDPRPDGPLLAVRLGHGERLDLGALELAQSSGTPVDGEVSRVVKGGLEVLLGGARAFCPASQLELSHVADLAVYVGQRLAFKVLEIREGGRSIVLSRRAVLEEQRREAALGARSRLIAGTDVEATVQALGRHGAVVDLDGVDGFIHISELAAHRVDRAEDAVRVGERIRARVLSVEDSAKGLRVRLSLRQLAAATDAPNGTPAAAGTTGAPAQNPDEVLTATVTRAIQHGVLVQTPRGEGLIPLRELGMPPGADHRRAFPAGKELAVVVVSRAGGRLTFSVTQVARVEERRNYRDFAATTATPSGGFGNLGDVLRDKLGAPIPGPATETPAPTASSLETKAEPAAERPLAPGVPAEHKTLADDVRATRSDVIRRRR